MKLIKWNKKYSNKNKSSLLKRGNRTFRMSGFIGTPKSQDVNIENKLYIKK